MRINSVSFTFIAVEGKGVVNAIVNEKVKHDGMIAESGLIHLDIPTPVLLRLSLADGQKFCESFIGCEVKSEADSSHSHKK